MKNIFYNLGFCLILFLQPCFLMSQNETEPNNTLQTANAITLSTTVEGSINPVGDLDFYKFTIPRAGIISYQITNVAANIAMEMKLYDANQVEIPNSSIYGSDGQNYAYEIKVCQGGQYYIRLREFGNNRVNAQLYNLTVRFDSTDVYECNDNLAGATPLTLNTPISGAIRGRGDLDYYKFTIPRAGIINYQISNVAVNVAMEMKLYDANQVEVPNSFVYGSDGQNYAYEIKVCQGGQYYIRLREFGNDRVNAQLYNLTVRFDSTDVYECNDNFAIATPIILNTPVSGAIRTRGDIDFYKFSIPKAGVINYQISSVASNIAMEMRLYDANQVEVPNSFVYGSDGQSYNYEIKVCEGGQYFIRLREFGNDRVNAQLYNLTMRFDSTDVYECNQDFATATPIHKNICATIRSAGDIDFYKINIPSSGNHTFSVQAPACIALSMILYDSNNQAVKTASNANRGGLVSFTQNITTKGSYYLAIQSYYGGESCGSLYCLTLPGTITSTTDYKADATLSIVPNPVTDRLTVHYAEGTIQNLQITNVTGQRMLQKVVNDAQTEIDVSSLSNGLYLLTMQTDQGQQIKKFVKN